MRYYYSRSVYKRVLCACSRNLLDPRKRSSTPSLLNDVVLERPLVIAPKYSAHLRRNNTRESHRVSSRNELISIAPIDPLPKYKYRELTNARKSDRTLA